MFHGDNKEAPVLNTEDTSNNNLAGAVLAEPVSEVPATPEEVEAIAEIPEGLTLEQAQVLGEEVNKYEIPESFEGHVVNSIVGIKHVGDATYVVAHCDDECTYDIPVSLKTV